MQEQRHEPPDRGANPLVRKDRLLERPDHEPLNQDSVKHRDSASNDSGHPQRRVSPVHAMSPVLDYAGPTIPSHGSDKPSTADRERRSEKGDLRIVALGQSVIANVKTKDYCVSANTRSAFAWR